jgi:hypothetical protein
MTKVHWNAAALERALATDDMQHAVNRLAGAIADEVRTHSGWDGLVSGVPGEDELPVKVYPSDGGDSAEAAVVLAHPAGKAVQAKHGSLTRAASALGLEVQG